MKKCTSEPPGLILRFAQWLVDQHLYEYEPKWFGISTAPKDGSEIMVAGMEGIRVAYWKDDEWVCGTDGSSGFNYDLTVCCATHWMPLPKYP